MTTTIEIGQPEGRTQYSDWPEGVYQKHFHDDRDSLSSSEFTLVMEGYLHEWACMGQCNLYIQAAKDPDVKQAIPTYRHDVASRTSRR